MRAPRQLPRHLRAFTLIELLVVCGIIAILLTILLPALQKMREYSNRVTCLSNLHTVHLTLEYYSQRYGGVVPLGYGAGQKFRTYTISSNDVPGTYQLFGLLFRANFMDNGPKAFYCPSQVDPRFRYKTPENTWPPPVVWGKTSDFIRMGYICRPTTDWGLQDRPLVGAMPRWHDYRNLAVLTDAMGIPTTYTGEGYGYTSHLEGSNVLYGNGSARWVPLNPALTTILQSIQNQSPSPGNGLYLSESAVPPTGFWALFDGG